MCIRDRYEKYATVYYTTEDGSYGEKGYPTQHTILTEQFDHIFCCGPEPMMKAVARYAYSKHIDCEVSLENTMACGIGACLCCVNDTKEGHKCVCTDGPVSVSYTHLGQETGCQFYEPGRFHPVIGS